MSLIKLDDQINKWEDFYGENKYTMWYPGEPTIRFFGRLSRKMEIKNLKGLDFGCGVGRHTVFMSKLGLNAYGIEISENAIKIAKEYSQKESSSANYLVYDGEKIPFTDSYFDIIVSHGVLDHMPLAKAKQLAAELRRVTKSGGYIELDLNSIFDSKHGQGEQIEKNVFVAQEGAYEVGIPHHYFNKEAVLSLLEGFNLEKIYLHEEKVCDNDFNVILRNSFWIIYARKQ